MIPVYGCVQEDEWGIVQTTGNGSVFLPDRDDIVRYHRSGMTVSRMEDTGGDLVSIFAVVMKYRKEESTDNRMQEVWMSCPTIRPAVHVAFTH